MKLNIGARLSAIVNFAGKCDVIADVGTDHAYIPIYMVNNYLCKKALALDIKQGPIRAAEKNIEKFAKNKNIEIRLGYGLGPLKPGEADTVIIAGMSGIKISEILEKGYNKIAGSKLILQPMQNLFCLKEYLYGNMYKIEDEILVKEGRKIHNIISIRKTGQKLKADLIDIFVGRRLINKNDPLLYDYVYNNIVRYKRIVDGLNESKSNRIDADKYKLVLNTLHSVLVNIGGVSK